MFPGYKSTSRVTYKYSEHKKEGTMHGAARAVAILVCLYALIGTAKGQPRVDSRNSYERILMVLPLVGSGTMADPIRPSLIPAPGSGVRTLQGIAAVPPTPILGYTYALSDDGNSR